VRLSISRRLAIMFAATGFLVFVLFGVVLHGVLQRELDRSERAELTRRMDLYTPLVLRNGEPARWHLVVTRLDAVTPDNGSARYWVLGDDPGFHYGSPTPELMAVARNEGYGEIHLEGHEAPLSILTRKLTLVDGKTVVRFVSAVDKGRYIETMNSFTYALIGVSIAGVLLVAVLGHWIAHFSLRPLERLAQEARGLSPSKLSQRLHSAGLPPELSELTASFNGALDRLESAYQQLEGFNADAAHELRTPLTNLIGQTQVALSREREAGDLEETLQSNLEELERLRAIVNDMLFLARADQGQRARDRVQVSLAQEIAKTVEYLDFVLDDAGVQVRIDGDATIAVETALLGRAMTNLLINAVQHSERSSEIVAEIASDANGVRVAVHNSGPRIADDHLARLFDRFYRLDSARSGSRDNHGLGLAIVRAIANMHGGSVFARSASGINTFGFTLAAS
jgi:two-component system heavy metal sensor histidine kinase CusS